MLEFLRLKFHFGNNFGKVETINIEQATTFDCDVNSSNWRKKCIFDIGPLPTWIKIVLKHDFKGQIWVNFTRLYANTRNGKIP